MRLDFTSDSTSPFRKGHLKKGLLLVANIFVLRMSRFDESSLGHVRGLPPTQKKRSGF